MKPNPAFRYSCFAKSFFCRFCQELLSSLWQKLQKIAFVCNKLSLQSGLTLTLLLGLLSLFLSCASIDKQNQHLKKPINPDLLKKDLNFVKKKLLKHQPSIDWYTSKDSLWQKFDKLDQELSKPLQPNEFYFQLAPIVSSIKQRHTRIAPLGKKSSKKQLKALNKKGKGPISQFEYVFFNDSLYISKSYSPDSLVKKGTKVLKINNQCPTDLYKKYRQIISSDGYNTSYFKHHFNKSLLNYFTLENGILDTIHFKLQHKDTIFDYIAIRLEKEKKQDRLKSTKLDQAKLKALKYKKKVFGWINEAFAKDFKIHPSDPTIAVLKISSFSQGKHKKAYAQIFDSIKKKQIKHLIIDLRGNPGGLMADMVDLYSYLASQPFVMNKKAVINNRASIIAPFFNHSPKWLYPLALAGWPFFATYQSLSVTKRNGQLLYGLPGSFETKPKPNAYKGKLYVLIDGGSFSAASIISAKLKSEKQAVFFGEETGGAHNSTVAGLKLNYTLPNSKLELLLWTCDIRMLNEDGEKGRGVMPDYKRQPNLEDLINKKDVVFEEVINFINK